jgi:hypothetical protein
MDLLYCTFLEKEITHLNQAILFYFYSFPAPVIPYPELELYTVGVRYFQSLIEKQNLMRRHRH